MSAPFSGRGSGRVDDSRFTVAPQGGSRSQMRQAKWLVPIATLVALAGTAAATPARGSDPWASLHRPLRLKPLAPGASCPVSHARRVDRGRLAGALGLGPVYPLGSSFGPVGFHAGWLGSKTIWAWPSRLRTQVVRVLVRGRRLDRPGVLRFQLGPQWDTSPVTPELHIDTTRTVGGFSHSDWGTTVTLLLVRSHGCYGLQLDSDRGTSTIVLRTSER